MIDCPRYEPLSGSKTCALLVRPRGCDIPGQLICYEWAKANGRPDVTPPPSRSASPRPSAPSAAAPLAPIPPTAPRPAHAPAATPQRALQASGRGTSYTQEDIDSWKALRAEVCIESPVAGTVWLVPAPTGQKGRVEVTPEQMLLTIQAAQALDGHVVDVTTEEVPF